MVSILPNPMASDRQTLKVSPREQTGSRESRRLRREGQVPGIVYSRGEEARMLQVGDRDLRAFLSKGQTLFDLEIEGEGSVPVVIKEQQRHPVRGEVLHIDFMEVDLKQKIEADVDVDIEGVESSPGVKAGGIMEHVTRSVTVFALPTDIPEHLTVDVSGMEIGDNLTLEAVTLPEGVELHAGDPHEVTIATLSAPRVEEEPEVEEETELIGEEGEEAEGEAAEDGGDEGSGDSDGDSGDGE